MTEFEHEVMASFRDRGDVCNWPDWVVASFASDIYEDEECARDLLADLDTRFVSSLLVSSILRLRDKPTREMDTLHDFWRDLERKALDEARRRCQEIIDRFDVTEDGAREASLSIDRDNANWINQQLPQRPF